MGHDDPRFLVVGHLSKPHGLKGDLFVAPLTDHPESCYAPGVVLRLASGDAAKPDPDLPPVRVAASRPFQTGWLVQFGGVDDRSHAEELRGLYLLREFDQIAPLAEGELFYHELLGMTVVTVSGQRVGEVREVFELSPADLLEVSDGRRTVMVPFLESIVTEIDREGRRIVIDPPVGLLDV
jgi:16S rRNA processing protein RimM